jgi:hypothetical protein
MNERCPLIEPYRVMFRDLAPGDVAWFRSLPRYECIPYLIVTRTWDTAQVWNMKDHSWGPISLKVEDYNEHSSWHLHPENEIPMVI